ncbi:MAG: S1C family serine protease [Polyangiaceae bacterium]|nr:S1C family serine protease [Polyangiaceae bacterium]
MKPQSDSLVEVSGCGRKQVVRRVITTRGLSFDTDLNDAQPEGPQARVARSNAVLNPQQIFARSLASIVRISTPSGQGSGFVVGASGLVVTSLHVVAGESEVKVESMRGDEWPVVRIEGYNRDADLVVIRTHGEAPALPISQGPYPPQGSNIVAIGHPLGLQATLSNGLISGVRSWKDEVDVLQISAPISPGSSGGPIFNDRGEVIGLATFILKGGEGLGFAIPIRYLQALATHLNPMPLKQFAAETVREADPDEVQLPPTVLDKCPAEELASVLKKVEGALSAADPLRDDRNYQAVYYVLQGAIEEITQKHSTKCTELGTFLARKKKQADDLDSHLEKALVLGVAMESLQSDLRRRTHEKEADGKDKPKAP